MDCINELRFSLLKQVCLNSANKSFSKDHLKEDFIHTPLPPPKKAIQGERRDIAFASLKSPWFFINPLFHTQDHALGIGNAPICVQSCSWPLSLRINTLWPSVGMHTQISNTVSEPLSLYSHHKPRSFLLLDSHKKIYPHQTDLLINLGLMNWYVPGGSRMLFHGPSRRLCD